MTSYSPYAKYTGAPDQWSGTNALRYATSEEAQAHLNDIAGRNPDLIDTKIIELPGKPSYEWINGDAFARGYTKSGALRPKGWRRK